MKKTSKITLLLACISFCASCTSTRKIQSNMNMKQHSIAYIMDSKVSESKTNIPVRIDPISFNPDLLINTVTVTREKGWFVPLVVVNVWHSQNNCILGKSLIEEDISSFFKTSLINEINRSGTFVIDTLNNTAYSLELTIDQIKTEGPYVSSGFFFFAVLAYGFSQSEIAGPAISKLNISYNLRSGDELIYSNSFYSNRFSEQINRRYKTTNLLHQDYAISMVEAKSYNIKSAIEYVVNDINTFFENQDNQ
jgi:hypothetical protein